MPYRISHPQRTEGGVMRAPICKNLMPDGIVLEKQDDLAGCLNNLHGKGMKINPRKTGRSTGVVKRVVCFRQGISRNSEGGLRGFILRLAPGGHGRLFRVELKNPVPLIDSD